MLHLQPPVLLSTSRRRRSSATAAASIGGGLPTEYPVAHLFAPLRQHEWVNAQRLGHILDQHAGLVAHLHGLELEIEPYRLIFCGPGVPIEHSLR